MSGIDPAELLQEALAQKGALDVVDVIPIPMHGDRMLRLRTLEEALEDFEHSSDAGEGQLLGYFVQVRPRKQASAPAPEAPPAASPQTVGEGIYLPDGKLNLPFLTRSAEMLYGSGDYALARNIYKAIAQSGEKTAFGLLGTARCYEAEGKLEEARIHYEESIAYHPQCEAYKALTSLLIRQKKDQEAAEVIERALHHRQLDPATRYELHKTAGNCWGRLGNAREAERHYKKALEISPAAPATPTSGEIQANLGALRLQHGKPREAERHFRDALEANPKSHQALMGLGTCALAEGDRRAAHDWFAKSLEAELRNPTAIYHLVKCAYELENYAAAARIVEDYVQVAPVNAHLLYSLAGLQFHLGQSDPGKMRDSRSTCERILQLVPAHDGARELLARIDRERGLDLA